MKIISADGQDDYQDSWQNEKLSILQSWQWGQFKSTPHNVIRVELGKYVVTIFLKQIPGVGWRFGYIPHGGPKSLFTKEISKDLMGLMKDYDLSHVLIDPYVPEDEVGKAPRGFIYSNQPSIQTRHTVVTELLDSDEEMMNRMRKKHRQYIRKSERLGLIFENDDSLGGVKRLAKVLSNQHTTKNYLAYPTEYYEKLWKSFEGTNMVHVYIVKDAKEDVGAYLVIDGSDRVFQFYGGTTEKGRKMYGAYLLTWKSMLAARDRGFKLYDQWGVASYDKSGEYDDSDERYGISVFKEGFTGQRITYSKQLAIVNNQSRFTMYTNLMKLHRFYIKMRKSM